MFLSFYCIVFPLCVAPTKITIKTLPQCNAVGGAAERSEAEGVLSTLLLFDFRSKIKG